MPMQSNLPEVWSALYTVQFMKTPGIATRSLPWLLSGRGIGRRIHGHAMPRKYLNVQRPIASETAMYGVFTASMSGLFILVSWLFFVRIRKRLPRLRTAMKSSHTVTGIPQPVTLTKYDEIGRLEEGYNDMVIQLEEAAASARKKSRANP